jgi:hypothetical protein
MGIRSSGLILMFLLLGTQRVLSHALSINTRQKQRSESRDSAKVLPRVTESSIAQGGVRKKVVEKKMFVCCW